MPHTWASYFCVTFQMQSTKIRCESRTVYRDLLNRSGLGKKQRKKKKTKINEKKNKMNQFETHA